MATQWLDGTGASTGAVLLGMRQVDVCGVVELERVYWCVVDGYFRVVNDERVYLDVGRTGSYVDRIEL